MHFQKCKSVLQVNRNAFKEWFRENKLNIIFNPCGLRKEMRNKSLCAFCKNIFQPKKLYLQISSLHSINQYSIVSVQ